MAAINEYVEEVLSNDTETFYEDLSIKKPNYKQNKNQAPERIILICNSFVKLVVKLLQILIVKVTIVFTLCKFCSDL